MRGDTLIVRRERGAGLASWTKLSYSGPRAAELLSSLSPEDLRRLCREDTDEDRSLGCGALVQVLFYLRHA